MKQQEVLNEGLDVEQAILGQLHIGQMQLFTDKINICRSNHPVPNLHNSIANMPIMDSHDCV